MKRLLVAACFAAACLGGGGGGGGGGPPVDPCVGVEQPGWAACSSVVATLRVCCYNGSVQPPIYASMTGESLCHAIVARGENPVTECGRFGDVAGACDPARYLASRGSVIGTPGCCCESGRVCEGSEATGFSCR